MNMLLVLAVFVGVAAPVFAQSTGNVDRLSSASKASVVSSYYAQEAPLDTRVGSDLRLASAYCLLHTFSTRSRNVCWRRVKEALVKAGVVSSYPESVYAYQAGDELVARYGFSKVNIRKPYDAPVGAILVYKDNGEGGGMGHVEFRTQHGFVSDYASRGYCKFKLTGVYIK